MRILVDRLRAAGCAALLACAACGASDDARAERPPAVAPPPAAPAPPVGDTLPGAVGALRDVLFGDVPLKEWARGGAGTGAEPWASFVRAHEVVESGNPAGALPILLGITQAKGLESRQYLQAWSALREHLGAAPGAPEGNRVLGVVVEVRLEGGLDVVAAYADHTARYLNQDGGGVVWEASDSSMNAAIDRMIAAGEVIARRVGPLDTPHLPPPPSGAARVNVLTPRGIRVGQGATDHLTRDPTAGPAMRAALDVMTALIARSRAADR